MKSREMNASPDSPPVNAPHKPGIKLILFMMTVLVMFLRWLSEGRRDENRRLRIENRLRAFIDAHHYHSITLYDGSGLVALHVGRPIEHEEDMTGVISIAMRTGTCRSGCAAHLQTRLSQGGELLALQSIKDWLLNHIKYADKPLGKFLIGKGVH
ncbi:MAG TPA: hypothetical protein VFF26_13750 [Gallionella sp.]|nr:hypothetical protein [Gallionella sp.]